MRGGGTYHVELEADVFVFGYSVSYSERDDMRGMLGNWEEACHAEVRQKSLIKRDASQLVKRGEIQLLPSQHRVNTREIK